MPTLTSWYSLRLIVVTNGGRYLTGPKESEVVRHGIGQIGLSVVNRITSCLCIMTPEEMVENLRRVVKKTPA